MCSPSCFFFFFNDTATTEIYTLSLHDALPISRLLVRPASAGGVDLSARSRGAASEREVVARPDPQRDRKSTRLNSSHSQISYAVFCLKKKKKITKNKAISHIWSSEVTESVIAS